MKTIDTIRRAGRNLKQAKARTLLTSLAIGVGAFTITLSLAAGEGGKRFISDIITSNTDPKAIFVQAKQEQPASGPREYSDEQRIEYGGGFSMKLLNEKDIEKIEKIEHVETVTPIYTLSVKYITGSNDKKYQIGAEAYDPTIKLKFAAGSVDRLNKGEVIVPNEYAKALGFTSVKDALGKTIKVVVASSNPSQEDLSMDMTIKAVTDNSALALAGQSNLLVSNVDADAVYSYANAGTPLEKAFSQATVTVADESRVEAVKESITGKGYDALTAEDILGSVFIFINVLQGILLGFGALAILTSVFGIINTQYISVLERTQQIGLMKALGMRRRDVGRLFKLEAAWIGFLGGALGAGLAYIAGVLGNPVISKALDIEDTRLLVFIPWHIGAIIAGLMIIAVLAGIFPARKAAKLDPIEALRTE